MRKWVLGVCLFLAGISGWAAEKASGDLVLKFPDERLTVNGLPWFNEDKPDIYRLPKRLKSTFRNAVWELARNSSGARIRFRTDSSKLTLKAKPNNGYVMNHITGVAQNGFDLYVDGLFKGSTTWVGTQGEINQTWDLGGTGKMREITLYLPLYKGVVVKEVDLDGGASVRPPSRFRRPNPVVYYGTSITQGGCASNPGMSFPAILGRWLKLDFVNLGFSGNGWGDESLAKAMAEIKASAYVLDYWANVSTEDFKKTLPPFVRILRQAFPKTPILVTGPFYQVGGFDEAKRKAAEDFVRARRGAGDEFIYFVDGRTMITEKTAYALVDGIHPNTLGFQRMADLLEPPLKKALGL